MPVDSSLLGRAAAAGEPDFVQELIVAPPGTAPPTTWNGALFCARKLIEHASDVYAASCSSRVLIYKGMLTAPQLRQYFADLRDGA